MDFGIGIAKRERLLVFLNRFFVIACAEISVGEVVMRPRRSHAEFEKIAVERNFIAPQWCFAKQ